MSGFNKQLKDRAKDLQSLIKRGMKFVENSCKKGWHKLKRIRH